MNSAYVDMYNATNNSWTRFPNGLGLARFGLAAASLPSGLVFFAGGYAGVQTARVLSSCDAWFCCCRAVTMVMAARVRCCEIMLLRAEL